MMHIEQTIEIYCGGPGSGRHPGFGTFRKFDAIRPYNNAKGQIVSRNRYSGQGGTMVSHYKRTVGLSKQRSSIYESKRAMDTPKKIFEGSHKDAVDLLMKRYGIKGNAKDIQK